MDSHSHHHHDHDSSHSHHHMHFDPSMMHDPKGLNRIRWAFWLNLSFACAEIVGGLLFSSVAILADAIHDFGDAFGLGLALFLQKLSTRGPTRDFSYGFRRLSIVSALCMGTTLMVGSIWVLIQAVPRLFVHYEPQAHGMMGLAIVGIIVNGAAAWILAKGTSHHEKILKWHLLEDFFGWVATIIGAVIIMFTGWAWVDAALAIVVALIILWNSGKNLYQTLLIFLQHSPSKIDVVNLKKELMTHKGVNEIHDLHVWTLDGENHVATLHVVVEQGFSEHKNLKDQIRHTLCHWGSFHVTIETESGAEPCGDRCDTTPV